MNNHDSILYTSEIETLFSQLPGIVTWTDEKQRYIGFNKSHVDLCGFKSAEQAYGKTCHDIPCKATELSDVFDAQGEMILKTGQAKKFFTIGCYFNDNLRATVAIKKPLRNVEGKIIGIFIQSADVTSPNLLSISEALIRMDSSKTQNIRLNQVSYELIEKPVFKNLTPREIECLFFLIRGKSIKEIAEILICSDRTVEHHLENIKNKLGCRNNSELICAAFESGFSNILSLSILQKIKRR